MAMSLKVIVPPHPINKTLAFNIDEEKKSPNYFEWRQKIHSSVYESFGITKRNPNLKIKKRWIGTFLDSTTIEKNKLKFC